MDTITLATGIIADRSVTFTVTVIVAGIGIVLCTLEAALSKASESVPAPAPASAPVIEEGISGEVVAAISAAVYAMEGGSAVIRSVSRKASPVSTRNPWAQAAVVDNTRPF